MAFVSTGRSRKIAGFGRQLTECAYMLRTNFYAGTAEELWSQYMQLTEAEASFRTKAS